MKQTSQCVLCKQGDCVLREAKKGGKDRTKKVFVIQKTLKHPKKCDRPTRLQECVVHRTHF
jgi:hypothetical protein